mmetsp:Transcript_30624/g.55872  ORF Transcript_30624/g.55872 Transcript_30624/m.55872 type:complete len:400 (-) Transcript_30624:58-1257(-)
MSYSHFGSSLADHHHLWEERVRLKQQPNLPWTSTQFLISANVFYLTTTFVLYKIMKARKEPLNCKAFKSILLFYNLTCVLAAGYVVVGILYAMLNTNFKFVCNKTMVPGSKEDNGYASFLAHVFWVFYAQKFWEFLDTWFFILRKSFRQVTFLHVFHHCSINIVVGVIIPYEFNGDMYLPILLNAVVHVLMYSHYLVSALGLSTPWKPFLTSMQLLQFVTIAIQSAISLSRGDSCGAPYFGKASMVLYMGSMLVLFGNFFVRSYILKNKSDHIGGGVIKRPEPIQFNKSHSGRVVLDAHGDAQVELPSQFSSGSVIQYQVTPIGCPMPNLHVSREPVADDCSFLLAGGVANCAVSWTVTVAVTILGETPKQKPLLSCCGDNAQDAQGFCCSSPHDKKGQ